MIPLEFRIFTPNKTSFTVSENLIIYSLWIFSICLFLTTEEIQPLKEFISPFKTSYLVLLTLLSVYLITSAFFRHERLNGKIEGILKIDFDHITINDNSYLLDKLSSIDFHFGNYFGKLNTSGNANFNPLLSQGVSNSIAFTDELNTHHLVYFKLNYQYEHETLFPFITEMIRLNKISFLRGIELLGINDYDEIQNFKKHLEM